MSTSFNRITQLAIIIGLIVLTALFITQKTYGSAPSGLPTVVATSTPVVLASQTATVVIATSTCAARVISTTNTQIMLTFSDYNNTAPTATYGMLQPASSTVAYDSGQYGCGLVKAFSVGGATNITVSDNR